MEKAIFIERIEDLKNWKPEYNRIYFGAEFCQRLIPLLEQLKKVLIFCDKKKIHFSFMTPFVIDEGLDKLKPLFKFLAKKKPETEIIVNDLGVAYFLSKEYPLFSLSLGRLLNKQKRDPRILTVTPYLPKEAQHYFRLPLGESIFSTDLKDKFNIKRIELDNLLQGMERENLEIPASLYYPYAYVTTTRYCLIALAFHEGGFKRKVSFKCNKECQAYTFSLASPQMPAKLYLKGNTQFIYNPDLPTNLKALNIDRIVYQKSIRK